MNGRVSSGGCRFIANVQEGIRSKRASGVILNVAVVAVDEHMWSVEVLIGQHDLLADEAC